MKKVGIMQPYLFPYIGYFQLINAVDEYVIYDDVQHIKRGRINRNAILINGEKHQFTISLRGASTTKNINQIEIQDDFNNFEKTIGMAYSKAPYYEEVRELIHSICTYEDKNLARFTGNSIKQIAKYLDINTRLMYSSELKKDNTLKGQEKILAICEALNADMYINAIGGQELYDKDEFRARGIELRFLKPEPREYKQFNNEFIPNLSIIDTMMFNEPRKIKEMLNEYELI